VRGRPHFLATRMRLLLQLGLLTTLSWACATAPSPRAERPDVIPVADSTPRLAPRMLHLTPGTTVYEFRQSSDIRPEGGNDTTYSTITTEALFSVLITAQSDSTHEITISADSVRITASGSAPSRSRGLESLPVSLGTLLRASLSPTTRSIEVALADSLCAYGQLVSAAHEIALLPLPYGPLLGENGRWSDSSRFSTCRAGTSVETRAFHEVFYSPSQPNELALRAVATVLGSGIMRTDSVTVNGTVSSAGKALLEGENRLPTRLRTESQATITVRLGDSTTVFRQQSTQEWHQRLPN
jgi:hypothetical protein